MTNTGSPEPLHPEAWFSSLRRLADAVDNLDSADSEMLLRQAYHIVRLTPAPLRSFFKTKLSEADLESLLTCKAYESAIFGLLGPPLALDISRDLHSHEVRATVAIDDDEVCGSGAHHSAAKAALSAWAKCVVKLSEVATRPDQTSNPA